MKIITAPEYYEPHYKDISVMVDKKINVVELLELQFGKLHWWKKLWIKIYRWVLRKIPMVGWREK